MSLMQCEITGEWDWIPKTRSMWAGADAACLYM